MGKEIRTLRNIARLLSENNHRPKTKLRTNKTDEVISISIRKVGGPPPPTGPQKQKKTETDKNERKEK